MTNGSLVGVDLSADLIGHGISITFQSNYSVLAPFIGTLAKFCAFLQTQMSQAVHNFSMTSSHAEMIQNGVRGKGINSIHVPRYNYDDNKLLKIGLNGTELLIS